MRFSKASLACLLCNLGRAFAVAEGAVVIDGAWRFTAVSNRLIRIEYDEKKIWVDNPTTTFFTRGKPEAAPQGVWSQADGAVDGAFKVMNTSEVSVRYQPNSPPSSSSLIVTSRKDSQYSWTWGDDPAVGNLGGTARTLDSNAQTLDLNCHNKVSPTVDNDQMHCVFGLASSKGWAVINDTGAPIWKDEYFAASEHNSTDVSVFLHGLDFAGALQDFYHAAGKPALPPRSAFGTIFTRWFDFDSDKVRDFVDDWEGRSIPLDTWIFDMNWHIFGPWGSYTWNTNSYPDLQTMLDFFQEKNLPIGANTHDHDGITTAEKTYDEVCAALGRAPGQNLPFDLYNKTYALTVEDISVRALDTKDGKQGIDFSWIDYQQGETDTFQQTTIPNINPTIVLNTLRVTDPQRHGENRRGMILSRWGGWGSHRYPVGFSGDQSHTWKGLAFLPYFTSTAANVGFNYWSHDTVGGDHDSATDYELSVRWVQTSAWSPVLRFHDKGAGTGSCATKDECARVVPWDLPNAFFMAVRDATQRRDELVPYMYTAAFSGLSTGKALCSPMYYEDSSLGELYGLKQQYLFGPDMVASPISIPSGPDAQGFEQALGAVMWTVYAPKTDAWVDRVNGNFAKGTNVTDTYGISDVPGLVRQGAVVPMRPKFRGESSLARARKPLDSVEFRVYPAEAFYNGGALKGSGTVIDDDGLTEDYLKGKYSTTVCNYSFNGRTFTFSFLQTGNFTGQPAEAALRLSFPQLPPLVVSAALKLGDGRVVAAPTISYDNHLLGSVVDFKGVDLRAGASVSLSIDSHYSSAALQNLVGAQGRVRRARYAKDALDALNTNYGDDRANLTQYALAGVRMSPEFATGLPQLWTALEQQVKALLSGDKTLKGDTRRSKFVSDMIQVTAKQGDTVVV